MDQSRFTLIHERLSDHYEQKGKPATHPWIWVLDGCELSVEELSSWKTSLRRYWGKLVGMPVSTHERLIEKIAILTNVTQSEATQYCAEIRGRMTQASRDIKDARRSLSLTLR